jgi:hypothetical protein
MQSVNAAESCVEPAEPKSAREREAELLARCVGAAREGDSSACDQREASVFGRAAQVLRSQFPLESANLMRASEAHFAAHPEQRLPPAQVLRQGWIATLPRLRDRLSRRLSRDLDEIAACGSPGRTTS